MTDVEASAPAEGVNDAPEQGAAQPYKGTTLITRIMTGGEPDDADTPGEDAKPEGEDKAPEQAEGKEEGKEGDKLSPVPESPDGYELAFDEGVSIDEDLLGGFKKAAHGLGITQEQAAKLAEFYAGYASRAGEQAQAAQVKALKETVAGWERELRTSPTYRADKEHVERAFSEFGSDDFYAMMDQTCLGAHPLMFRFAVEVGKALAEADIKGTPAPEVKTRAEVMYPEQNK